MKYIKGFENYGICKNGMIYSHLVNRFLKTNVTKSGYEKVNLFINGKEKVCLVHRLVAMAYITNPNNKPYVNHINGDKLCNIYHNLEWVTAKENTRHAWDNGLCKNTLKQRITSSKIHSKHIYDTKNKIYFSSVKDAALYYGIYYPRMKNMLNGAVINKTPLKYV
jgi:hypothetical protein